MILIQNCEAGRLCSNIYNNKTFKDSAIKKILINEKCLWRVAIAIYKLTLQES